MKCSLMLSCVLWLALFVVSNAGAQGLFGNQDQANDIASPSTLDLPHIVMTKSITAAGDWTRAHADAYARYAEGNYYYAEARKKIAEAVSMELDNYLKYAETYYNRRIERERSKLEIAEIYEERKDKYGEYRKNAKERLLKAILTDRERNAGSGQSDVALNKLLYALAETPVAYGIDLGDSISNQVESRMKLSPSDLRLIQIKSPGSQKQTVSLTQKAGMDLSWWPDHLRQDTFATERNRLHEAMQAANRFAGVEGQMDFEVLNELNLAFAGLSQKYMKMYPPSRKKQLSTAETLQYIRTDDFLTRLFQDIQRMRDTGRVDVMGNSKPFDPDRDGANAATLATWMLRNGVSFGPPLKGNESAYSRVFSNFADLYGLVGQN